MVELQFSTTNKFDRTFTIGQVSLNTVSQENIVPSVYIKSDSLNVRGRREPSPGRSTPGEGGVCDFRTRLRVTSRARQKSVGESTNSRPSVPEEELRPSKDGEYRKQYTVTRGRRPTRKS